MTDDVLLRDLVAKVGSESQTVALLDQVRGKVTVNALGEAFVTSKAARAVLDVIREENAERNADQSAYSAWVAERAAKRAAIAQAAYDKTVDQRRQAERTRRRAIDSGELEGARISGPVLVGGGDAFAARQAASAAVSAFDAENPDPGFEAWRESRAGRRTLKAARA